ncbi:MAG TPA: cell division ATP-binding protein FtsE [Desulfobacterales bacterium]|jgi:cell division transport system ATP-binding protein|nr:cell division ATP-binding protein FtsE [Desulfobacterales bacterium]
MTDEAAERPIVRLSHVHQRYGRQAALTDLSLDIRKNEMVFVSGPSGAGKSTLLKLLYGAVRPTEGRVEVDGLRLEHLPARRLPLLRRRLGIVFQDFKLIPTRSVFDNVAIALEACGHRREAVPRKVRQVLRTVGMEAHAGTLPPLLSGGEQQRVAVARAVVGDPKLLLADEPTGNLDDDSARAVMELLRAMHIRGTTLVIATHDRALVDRLGGRGIHLVQGRLAPAGDRGGA